MQTIINSLTFVSVWGRIILYGRHTYGNDSEGSTMSKKNKLIIFLLIALMLIGGVTYAAYVQTSVAKGTSVVARWRFKVNNNKESFTIDLAKNASNLLNGKIGPGSYGSFDIVLDGTGSQVDIDYVVSFDKLENIPINMKFYDDPGKNKVVSLSSYEINGIITYGGSMQKKHTIYWEWPIEGNGDTGYAGKTLSFDVLVDAIQKTN